MRYLTVALSVICWAVSVHAATIFDGSFSGCTDAGTCNTGTGWDTETDTGSDMVCDDGDLDTTFAGVNMCADVMNDTTVALVEEDTAFSTEAEVYGRWYFRVIDGGTYINSENFNLLLLRNEADNDSEGDVRLVQTAGGFWGISSSVELDDGTSVFVQSALGMGNPVANTWNCIQFHWRASSGAGANDGLWEIWLNGRALGSVTGVDNDTGNVGEVRLGDVANLEATPAMTLLLSEPFFDDATLPECLAVPPGAGAPSGFLEATY